MLATLIVTVSALAVAVVAAELLDPTKLSLHATKRQREADMPDEMRVER